MEATLKGGFNPGIGGMVSDGLAGGAAEATGAFGIRQPAKAAETGGAVNTLYVEETTADWLAPLVGASDSDPFYARRIEDMEENRRRTAAEPPGMMWPSNVVSIPDTQDEHYSGRLRPHLRKPWKEANRSI